MRRGYNLRRNRDLLDLEYGAWLTAAWVRRRRLPRWDEVERARKRAGEPPRPKTDLKKDHENMLRRFGFGVDGKKAR